MHAAQHVRGNPLHSFGLQPMPGSQDPGQEGNVLSEVPSLHGNCDLQPMWRVQEGSFKSSEQWRTEGNAHFLAGKGAALHVSIRRARLEKARECYTQVWEHACPTRSFCAAVQSAPKPAVGPRGCHATSLQRTSCARGTRSKSELSCGHTCLMRDHRLPLPLACS
jgi:hypothetical protein